MEPALDERGDLDGERMRVDDGWWPQWSPLSTSGATCWPTSRSRPTGWRRNGARSRRAGRPVNDGPPYTHIEMPQWSPLSTSGATRPDPRAACHTADPP